MSVPILISELEQLLVEVRDDERAKAMAAYMKGHFSYYGVAAPIRNDVQKRWFALLKTEKFDFWELIHTLWERNEREFQMVAVDLLKNRTTQQFERDDWSHLEVLITSKSWWDTVDLIASNPVGKYFLKFPEMRDEIISKWRMSSNFWLNRTCLLFQLKYKKKLDFELLTALIDAFKSNKEFFIQKAIGWSLRQHSKENPEAVRDYLSTSGLSGLALREASKYLG